jgi:DNA-directed RNA polymerase subunit M
VTAFCPKCGGLLKPKREGGKVYLVCSRCNYRVESPQRSLTVTSKIEHSAKEKTIVVEESELNLPVTRDVVCKRCGHNEAYYWVIQTRAADEPPTRFYKCVKCGYTWREYE